MSEARTYTSTEMCDGEFLELFEPTARDSDIFISTCAKCGQTWLQTLLFHLKTSGLVPDLGGQGLWQVSPWLELPSDIGVGQVEGDRNARLARLEQLDDARIFKLHVFWHEIPRAQGSKARIITITRDPRDVPFSMYSHLHAMKHGPGSEPPADFGEYFETWMERGFYFDFMKSFWPHYGEEGVLFLRYEELQRDLRAECYKILAFLGWQRSEEVIDRVLPLVEFGHMRATEKTQLFRGQSHWKEEGHFFREGALGKNRARLSAEQERRIVERAHRELGPACSDFVLAL